jgi:hypothetical protein
LVSLAFGHAGSRPDFDAHPHRYLHTAPAVNKSSSMRRGSRRIGGEIQGTQCEKARPLFKAGLLVGSA